MREFFLILAAILVLGTIFWLEDVSAQYMSPIDTDIDWNEIVEVTVQDFVESILLQNEDIIKESVKTKIIGSLRDVYPPFYHVRIIYDVIQNNEIQHVDSIYKVNFGPLSDLLEDVKLEKIFEGKYEPPKKYQKLPLGTEDHTINWILQNIMCRQGFEKIVKDSDNSTACVKLESIPKLIERGWAKESGPYRQVLGEPYLGRVP